MHGMEGRERKRKERDRAKERLNKERAKERLNKERERAKERLNRAREIEKAGRWRNTFSQQRSGVCVQHNFKGLQDALLIAPSLRRVTPGRAVLAPLKQAANQRKLHYCCCNHRQSVAQIVSLGLGCFG